MYNGTSARETHKFHFHYQFFLYVKEDFSYSTMKNRSDREKTCLISVRNYDRLVQSFLKYHKTLHFISIYK